MDDENTIEGLFEEDDLIGEEEETPGLSEDDILAIIQSELSQADNSTFNGTASGDLEDSLRYYLGKPNGTEIEGRSQVVSTDVADAIEWIMPQIMKSFTQNNEIVIFDPVHEGDERQAELESEYVYEVLMKQNDGFIILHQFVKDALMQKNGILKVYYANRSEFKVANYTGITEQQLQQLLVQQGVELRQQSDYIDENATRAKQEQLGAQLQQLTMQMQQAQNPQQLQQMQQQGMQLQAELEKPVVLYDVKISVERIRGQIYVDPVPPEEFRLNAGHNSINLDSARFTAHVVPKTISDVLEDYPDASLEELKDYTTDAAESDTEYRFTEQDENITLDRTDTLDVSQQLVELAECFLQIDVEGTGISRLMKITTVGGEDASMLLSMEEIDCMPWVSTTAFLMSHKFKGLSIKDRLEQIQDHKTALWRNMLDNMYLQNNQRNVVVEGQVNMDDLLVSRPGGIIRAKRIDAVMPLTTPQMGQDAYQMMEYLDRVRSGRTGVDPDGNATPTNIGERVGSQGVDRLMNAKEELVGLIIRVIAETGIKPLCTKIRDLSTKHIDAVVDFRFRGVWEKIKPSEWEDRTQCTVRVGTGTGNHMQKLGSLREIMTAQSELLTRPDQALVNFTKMYTALDDFCKESGLNGAVRYFVDPGSPEGKQMASKVESEQLQNKTLQDKMNLAMAESQQKLAEAEMAKANAQMASTQAKAQTEQAKNELQLQKQTYEAQMKMMEQQLAEAEAVAANMGQTADLQLRKYQIDQSTALELTRIEKEGEQEQNDNFEQNRETTSE